MPVLRIGNLHLYYEVHGKGPPLLLVAGLASDSKSWQPVLGELSKHYCVIVFDNRCAGRTSPDDMDMSISLIADDCIALIDYLGFHSACILGHSMGGFVAMDCAIRYPDRVDTLILAATSAFTSKRNSALLADWVSFLESGMDLRLWFRNIFYWIFSRTFFENEKALDEALRLAIEYPHKQSPLAFRKQVEAIAEYNCLRDLSAITAKTLVICGSEDLLFPPGECALLAERIPDAQYSLINNAAHSIHMEYPVEFTGRVLHFLSGH